ncbi:MAG: N-acetyltransferase [Chitinophagaceae bacterium]|nr:MAG: N-acetyltransferase [Chitinophagaceae bacterium]
MLPRLHLRPFVASDLANVYRGLSHPQVIPYYGVRYDSLEATKAQMEFFATLEREGTGRWWAVCSPDNKEFYGAGGLNGLHKEHRKAEIGFWLLPEYWRRGFMQEAIPAICRYGFETMNLHRIEGLVESENAACRRAMDRLGFSFEGMLRDCEWKDGRFISLAVYTLLATDDAARTLLATTSTNEAVQGGDCSLTGI